MEKPGREWHWIQGFQPRAIIFGFSLGIFVLTCVHDFHLSTQFSQPGYSPYVGNPENQIATFLLVFASLGLLLRKWWSHLIAIVVGGKIFYNPGYLSLWIYANVQMGGSCGFATWKNWFHFTLDTQPQYILHSLLGGIICLYAAVVLSQQIIRSVRTRANKSLQVSAG